MFVGSSGVRKPSAQELACRFEQLALGYDEDDIGSLADDDPDVAGDTAIDEFSDALDEFLASEPGEAPAFQQRKGPGTRGLQYRTAAEDVRARDPDTCAEAAATLAKVTSRTAACFGRMVASCCPEVHVYPH